MSKIIALRPYLQVTKPIKYEIEPAGHLFRWRNLLVTREELISFGIVRCEACLDSEQDDHGDSCRRCCDHEYDSCEGFMCINCGADGADALADSYVEGDV